MHGFPYAMPTAVSNTNAGGCLLIEGEPGRTAVRTMLVETKARGFPPAISPDSCCLLETGKLTIVDKMMVNGVQRQLQAV